MIVIWLVALILYRLIYKVALQAPNSAEDEALKQRLARLDADSSARLADHSPDVSMGPRLISSPCWHSEIVHCFRSFCCQTLLRQSIRYFIVKAHVWSFGASSLQAKSNRWAVSGEAQASWFELCCPLERPGSTQPDCAGLVCLSCPTWAGVALM